MKVLRWVFEDWGPKDTRWLKIALAVFAAIVMVSLMLNGLAGVIL